MKTSNIKTISKYFSYTLLCVVILNLGCTSENDFKKGKKQLEQQGYKNVEDTGYGFFCCDEKDNFSVGFKAIDKDGDMVKGCICSGFLKGLTIRFE
jgi:hypothetical protein